MNILQLPKDKNGKTEIEFLREYDVTKYFRPSVTVDAVLFYPHADGVKILMVERGGHPFIGKYALPGGFVERDESCEAAVARELFEETGVADVPLRQLLSVSTPDRDPRWRNITVVYCGKADESRVAVAGDDAAAVKWFFVKTPKVGELVFECDDRKFSCKLDVARDAFDAVDINATRVVDRGKTAFDHAKIVYYLIDALRKGEIRL